VLSASAILSISILIKTIPQKILTQEENSELQMLLDKGVSLSNQGRYEEAITNFDKLLAIYPDDIDALTGKAVTLHDLGRVQDAITYYDKVLEIDPNDVGALNNKIAALGKLTPDLTPASISNNAYVPSPRYLYVSESSDDDSTVVTTNNAATCENNYKLVERGLKLQPDNIMILTNAGINLAQKCGKYEESITYYDRALAVNATYVPAMYNKGISLEKLGNHAEAQGLFDKAKELDPNYKTDFIVGAPRAEPLPSPI